MKNDYYLWRMNRAIRDEMNGWIEEWIEELELGGGSGVFASPSAT